MAEWSSVSGRAGAPSAKSHFTSSLPRQATTRHKSHHRVCEVRGSEPIRDITLVGDVSSRSALADEQLPKVPRRRHSGASKCSSPIFNSFKWVAEERVERGRHVTPSSNRLDLIHSGIGFRNHTQRWQRRHMNVAATLSDERLQAPDVRAAADELREAGRGEVVQAHRVVVRRGACDCQGPQAGRHCQLLHLPDEDLELRRGGLAGAGVRGGAAFVLPFEALQLLGDEAQEGLLLGL
mmetsp:Transcript_21845/g.60814  ORF Transcript_21845/g.60814 Transcript_21845/m.60814 type:complete len:237 (-) Transcript_21845:220-930(-)